VTRFVLLALSLALPAPDAAALKSGPERRMPVDLVVIHSTGGPTCDPATGKPRWVGGGTLDENLRTIEAHPKLGIHYMIDRDGTLRSSVPEHQVAHHVFRHSPRSIAIELINDGDGVDPYPEAQLASLVELLRRIVERHRLGPQSIRGHADLDHGTMPCDRTRRRKVDPGPAFPMARVVERVFGAGPGR
jgi:hypothetical protein